MKLKDRIKTYSFWVSLTSAVILIVKLIGQKYGFAIDEIFISDLITTVCGLLVILGIIVVPKVEIKNEKDNSILNITNGTTDDATNNTNNETEQILQEKTIEDIVSQEDNAVETITFQQDTEPISFCKESPDEELTFNDNFENINSKNETTLQPNFIENEIKNHITKLLALDKNNYSNNFNTYKKILIDEINKIDE